MKELNSMCLNDTSFEFYSVVDYRFKAGFLLSFLPFFFYVISVYFCTFQKPVMILAGAPPFFFFLFVPFVPFTINFLYAYSEFWSISFTLIALSHPSLSLDEILFPIKQ